MGLKPTLGLVPLGAGDTEHWHGLSSAGFVTRTVEDTALVLDAVLGGRGLAAAVREGPGRLRIAVSERAPVRVKLDARVRAALRETVELLRGLGHEVVEADPAYGLLQPGFLARYLRGIHDDFMRLKDPGACEPRTRAMAQLGGRVPLALLRRARAAGRRAAQRLASLPGGADVLLTPTLVTPPQRVGAWEGQGAVRTMLGAAGFMAYTPAWNVTGQPAASVPAGFTPEGLPLAVQLVGPPLSEGRLLAVAAQLEAARGWVQARPALATR